MLIKLFNSLDKGKEKISKSGKRKSGILKLNLNLTLARFPDFILYVFLCCSDN